MWRCNAIVLAVLASSVPLAAQSPTFGVGGPATTEEIRDLGVAIAPDGGGLPEGSGTVAAGRDVFVAQCARCHGPKGEGDVGPALAGGQGTLRTTRPLKTVGSYWPYATTLWDYINRAMPFDHPSTLTPDEVYAATAYVLFLNGIVGEQDVLSERIPDAIARRFITGDSVTGGRFELKQGGHVPSHSHANEQVSIVLSG